jgi:predicted NAD-dependent protein-ADP-ribosyltransferase YbiA (DUF1768 family)
MSLGTSFEGALKDYYLNTKNQNPEKKGLLIFDSDNKWKEIKPGSKVSSSVFMNTLQKVVTLNLSDISETHLLYWIEQFNSAMALDYLKNKEIKPVDQKAKRIQFSSMNDYRWLSNFFLTLIYDQNHKILYPSVENGYVAFKARKANSSDEEVLGLAHLVSSKKVKQLGSQLWNRSTEAEDKEAIAEMERLVSLKFQQNPFLATWLKKSCAPLEEFTNDTFWGSAMGTLTEDDNANQLGQIIGRVRAALKQDDISK